MEWELFPITVPITTIRYEPTPPAPVLAHINDQTIQDGYRMGMTQIRVFEDFAYGGQGLLQNLIRLGYSEVTVYSNNDPTFRQYLINQGFLDG